MGGIESLASFLEAENEENPTAQASLVDILAKKEELKSNITPVASSIPAPPTGILSLLDPKSNEAILQSMCKNLFKTDEKGESKYEQDVSFEYAEENKEIFVKLDSILTKVTSEKQNPLEMSLISRIPLLAQEETEEVQVQYRSLPKNIKVQNSKHFVMLPKYRKSVTAANQEVEIPDPEQFMCLGYDTPDKKNKHYRYVLNKELEYTMYMGARAFQSIPIHRGKQTPVSQGFLSKIFSANEPIYKEVGCFKGVVDIISNDDLNLMRELELEKEGIKLNVPIQEKEWSEISPLELELMKKSYVSIRVYVIEADIYDNYDIGSDNDPYLKIRLGKEEINDCANFIQDKNHPQFLKSFELKTTFPGDSHLKIEVWDKDLIKTDELIGATKIDIENRFYDQKYRELEHIPIETRKLYHPTTKQERGTIKLWVEIFQAVENDSKKKSEECQKMKKVWDISPRPPTELELRVIVWETKDVPMADVEDTVDIFVTGSLPGMDENTVGRTDVHYRSQTGYVALA